MKNLLKLFAILLLLVLPLGASADFVLPDDLTVIEAEAFLNDTALTGELTIPDGVTVIGERAFSGCSGITTIEIPSSVTAIEAGAFSGCTGLTGPLFLHKGITIAEDAFADCENLFVFIEGEAAPAECFSYIINADDTVTIQGFYGPAGVSELMIPSIIEGLPVTAIGNDAFSNDLFSPNFTSITIPEGVTSIGAYALCGCECLTELNLPSTLQSIGENSLSSLIALPSLTLPESLVSVGEGAISNNLSMTSLNIPDSLVSINMNAWSIPFSRNPVLAQVTISENHPAFTVNGGLLMTKDQTRVINSFEAMVGESCTLPETVTNLCTGVFAHNKTLKSVTLSDIITEIPMDTFLYCTALEEVHLPSALETIRTTAFARSTALTHIVIPDGTVTIESGAFMDCSALTSADIPQSVTSISSSAFTNCPDLTIYTTAGSAAHLLALEENIPVKLTATDPSKLCYTISDGAVTITGLAVDEYGAAIVIPDTIEGCPVTAIADDAFKSCYAASITIPASVTSVGQTVFYASYQLSAIHVEAANPAYKSVDGVLLTKDGSKLICCPAACPFTTYTVPGTVTSLDIYAFAYCQGLEEVILPDGLTEISERAFFYCRSMPAITIPEGVTAIGANAFSYCEALTEIDLPASVQSIGDGAFDDCSGLTTVSLPSTVTSLGSFVFSGCTSLTDILVDENNPSYASHDGILMSKDGTTLMIHPAGRTYTSFTVPDTVTYLDGGAFGGCVNLESITLPDTLTFLTNYVFSNCTNLKSINIPASVTGIHVKAFNGCYNLTVTVEAGSFGESWAIEKGIPYVVTGAAATPAESFTYTITDGEVTITGLADGVELTEIVIPDTIDSYPVTAIGFEAFWCDSFSSIVIPEGVTVIQDRAFCFNEKLSSVSIPSTMTNMDNECFYGCSALTSLDIAEDHPVYSVQNGMIIKETTKTVVGYLYGYNVISTDMVVPEGVEIIGQYGLRYCEWMTSLSLPSTLKRIEVCAFSFDESLTNSVTSLTIPESVEYIGYWAFGKWQNLTSLTISPDIACIEELAFGGCTSLTGTLEFSSSANIHETAFSGCNNLTVTIASSATPADAFTYTIADGEVTITGLADGVELTEIVIPDTIEGCPVTAVGYEAFKWNATLTSVTLPEGLKLIDSWAFQTCRSLASINLPSTLTTINNCAFVGCSSLTSLTIPEGMTEISDSAFDSCTALTTLNLPSTLKTIGAQAFSNCAFTSVTIPEGVNKLGTYAFSDNANLSYVKIPSTLTDMDNAPFLFCSSLAELDIADDHPVYSIQNGLIIRKDTKTVTGYLDGYSAVSTDVVIPEGIEIIDTCALRYCFWATSVTLPSTLKRIENHAFGFDGDSNSNITTLTIPESVEHIGYWAFGYWRDLTELNVSPDIGYIDDRAFADCISLTGTLEFSSSANIHADAFNGCTNLTITIASSVTPADAFTYTNENGKVTITGLADGVELTEIVIPATIDSYPVTAIGWEAFFADSFSSITIPEGVTTIGMHAFSCNDSLSYVSIPSTLTDMDGEPFSYCSSLAELDIAADHSVYSVQNGLIIRKATKTVTGYLYGYKATGTDVVIPEGIEVIGECALRYCDWMTSLTLPSTLKRIEDIAFGFDDSTCNVTSLTIPESVEYIGYWAFGNWQNLTELNISPDTSYIDDHAFGYCYSLTGTLTFSSKARIHVEAFYGCDDLTVQVETGEITETPASHFDYEIIDGKEVTILSYNSYLGYTEVIIPAQIDGCPVTTIADLALCDKRTITSITIPDSVTSIGEHAFACCSLLTTINIPNTVVNFGNAILTDCPALTTIILAEDHPVMELKDGMLYEKSSRRLNSALNIPSATTLTIPDFIRTIGTYSVMAEGLKSITLSDGVETIETNGIHKAYNLTSLTVSSTLTTLKARAVTGCYSLRAEITLPHGASVASNAFPDGNVTVIIAPESEEYTPAEYFYYTSNDTGLTITGYNGPETITTLRIPAEINDQPVNTIGGSYLLFNHPNITTVYIPEGVTALAAECFRESKGLENIYLPSTLQSIGDRCFVWCDKLQSIEIPDSVTSFGTNIFGECRSMISCKLPSGLKTLPFWTFGNCTSLETLTLPDGLETIDRWAFTGAVLDTLVLPDSVTTLEEEALYWFDVQNLTLSSGLTEIPAGAMKQCYFLTSIVVPEGVTSIGDEAFMNCHALASVSLPSTLTSLGTDVFTNCHALETVTIADGNTTFGISNGALMNVKTGEMLRLLTGIAEDGSYTIGSDVKIIGSNVFFSNSNLTSVVIPEGVMEIGDSAFLWCQNLTSVSIPSTVTRIAENAFGGCRLLDTITVAQGNEHYSVTKGMLVSADKTLLIPIGGLNATSYTVPEGIIRIGDCAFFSAQELTSVTLPSTVTSIGDEAFAATAALQSINLPEGLITLGYRAFGGTGLTSMTIPDTITTIGEKCFADSYITTIQLSAGLSDIPKNAFEFSALTEITLPAGIRTVGEYAFGNCENLTSITLNDGLTTLGFGAFAYCNNVESVYIPASVTSIDDWAFGVTQNNAVFTVHRGSKGEEFCKWNRLDFVYTADSYTPIAELTYTATETAVTITGYTGTDTEVILPEEIDGLPVTAIGDSAFAGSAITGIVFPTALESIGASAFDGCTALVEVTLPDGLLSIGDYAFRGCKAIQNGILHIPGTVQTIGALIADKDSIILSIVPGTPGEQYAMDNGYNWGC